MPRQSKIPLPERVARTAEAAAVVVRFSTSRRRYERQGLLVEAKPLAAVAQELGLDRPE